MGVNLTLIHGFMSQVQVMKAKVKSMEGYTEEDLNPYWELVLDLEHVIDNFYYIVKDLEKNDKQQDTLGFE